MAAATVPMGNDVPEVVSALGDEAEELVPQDFKCCITRSIMREPVLTCDGHSYEREAIQAWFATGRVTSPSTGMTLRHTELTPNIALRKAISSYIDELPRLQARLEAQHRRVADLQACLEQRERALVAAEAERCGMVARSDFERLSANLQRAERELVVAKAEAASGPAAQSALLVAPLNFRRMRRRSSGSVRPAMCSRLRRNSLQRRWSLSSAASFAGIKGAPWELLAADRIQALQRQRASVEAARFWVEEEQSKVEARSKDAKAAVQLAELEAAAKEHEAAEFRALALDVQEQLRLRISVRDSQGEAFRACADEVGMADSQALDILERVREAPELAQKGKMLLRYAELQRECNSLQEAVDVAQQKAAAAEEEALASRTCSSGLKEKTADFAKELLELKRRAYAFPAELERIDRDLARLDADVDRARAAAAWAQGVSGLLAPTAENLPILMVMHQQAEAQKQQAALMVTCARRHNDHLLDDAKAAGLSAATLRAAGFSLTEIVASHSAAELIESHLDAAALKAEGIGAKEVRAGGHSLQDCRILGFAAHEVILAFSAEGLDLEQLRAAGFTASECQEAGVAALALRNSGFTCRELIDAGFSAEEALEGLDLEQLRAAGFTASDCQEAGATAQTLRNSGFSCRELIEAGCSAEEVLEVLGFPNDAVALEPGAVRRTWAFVNFPAARQSNKELLSEELRFSDVADPRHRYSFQINVDANGSGPQHRGNVSVFFVPQQGPDAGALEWPMRHKIRLRVLSSNPASGEGTREMVLNPALEGDREWFAALGRPAAGSRKCRGFMKMLTRNQFNAGDYLFDGDVLFVQCDLVP